MTKSDEKKTKAELMQEILDIVNSHEVHVMEQKLMKLIEEGKLTFGYFLVHDSMNWHGYKRVQELIHKAAQHKIKRTTRCLYRPAWYYFYLWLENVREERDRLAEIVAGFED
ncbi:MAG: hypothetical protein WC992_06825 [Acholeplasmataceae bacterium]